MKRSGTNHEQLRGHVRERPAPENGHGHAWTCYTKSTKSFSACPRRPKDICELRNMINVGYLTHAAVAIERKESRGLHYTIDYPKHAYDQKIK